MKQWVFGVNSKTAGKNPEEQDRILNKWMKPKDNIKSSISESSESDSGSYKSRASRRSANVSINDKDRDDMKETLRAQEQVYKSQDESSSAPQKLSEDGKHL